MPSKPYAPAWSSRSGYPMIESRALSITRHVLRGPTDLRAGWRLCIFLAIDFALLKVFNQVLPLLSADDSVLYLLRDAAGLLACMWRSIGARPTSMAYPIVARLCQAIC